MFREFIFEMTQLFYKKKTAEVDIKSSAVIIEKTIPLPFFLGLTKIFFEN